MSPPASINRGATPSGIVRRVAIEREAFECIRSLMRRHAGIRLNDSKRALVESRLAHRLRHHRITSYNEYLAILDREPESELEQLINCLTTNKTSFFREPHHFDFLRQVVFPGAAGRTLRVWSAGCSTGAEPYSIAICAADAAAAVRILATDIDTNVLATARTGSYTASQLAGVAPEVIRRHFESMATGSDLCTVSPAIREVVTFRRHNLTGTEGPSGGTFDLIFCRNVSIYFDRETQRNVFRRLGSQLRPGGVLFLGHAESLALQPADWEGCGRTMYRRVVLRGPGRAAL